MNKKIPKSIPAFTSEKQEQSFWQHVDSTEYVDYSQARHVNFPNLKLTTKPITIRLQESLIDRIKVKANKLDMPYQTLIKQLIAKGLATV